MEITLNHYLGVAAVLFVIGLMGVIMRRNLLIIYMSLEMMLQAANLTFIAFSKFTNNIDGQVFVFFVITVAAAEVAVGLALIVALYRIKQHHPGRRPDHAQILRTMDIAWYLLLAPLAASRRDLCFISIGRPSTPSAPRSAPPRSAFSPPLGSPPEPSPPPTPYSWISLPDLNVSIGMIFDPLSKGMLLVVTGVGLLIHIYSIGYMAHDPSKGRFFGGLSIFMFSMTGITLADNLIMLFLFWEGVGLSSYLLIRFLVRKGKCRPGRQQSLCL